MNRLLAFDASAILRRMFEASAEPNLETRAREAAAHAVSLLGREIPRHAPTHVLAAIGKEGRTWRHELHPAFRQHHHSVLELSREREQTFLAMLADLGIDPVCVEGFDPDDAVATAVVRWSKEGRGEAIAFATNKRTHTLIESGALLWEPYKNEWHDADWVEKKYGVPPSQLTDYLALIGDTADGVPGVTGIGARKAAHLLRSYRSIEGILAGAGILMDRIGTTLRRERQSLLLSRELVAVKTNAVLGVTWRQLAWEPH